MTLRILGYILIGAALVLFAAIFYFNSSLRDKALVFSPTQMMQVLWADYKETYLEAGTLRAIDRSRDNVTTSEGQSYTMLRAVWMGDKETFDTSWQWTKDNLMHEDTFLFAWLFGKLPDGAYGILESGGGNTSASDADTDIALALIFAYARWQNPQYIGEARSIISDIWEHEVLIIEGIPYMTANNIEKTSNNGRALINPSYLSPGAYRIFAQVDSKHPWNELAESSYDLIEQSMTAPLDTGISAGLPPDWIQIDKQTAQVSPPPTGTLKTHFSYDAMRVPWRLALDYKWFQSERAKEVLERMEFLEDEWRQKGKLLATYTHSGEGLQNYESPAMYGGTIGYFSVTSPPVAEDIYEDKLALLFDQQTNSWRQELSYYDSNWAWFGVGLYSNLLPNLTASLPKGALQK